MKQSLYSLSRVIMCSMLVESHMCAMNRLHSMSGPLLCTRYLNIGHVMCVFLCLECVLYTIQLSTWKYLKKLSKSNVLLKACYISPMRPAQKSASAGWTSTSRPWRGEWNVTNEIRECLLGSYASQTWCMVWNIIVNHHKSEIIKHHHHQQLWHFHQKHLFQNHSESIFYSNFHLKQTPTGQPLEAMANWRGFNTSAEQVTIPIGKDRLPSPPFFKGELSNFGGV